MEEFFGFREGCLLVDGRNDDEYVINSIQAFYQRGTDPVCFSRVEVGADASDEVEDTAGEWLRDELTAQGYSAVENFKEKAVDHIFEQTEMDEEDKDKIEVLPEYYED